MQGYMHPFYPNGIERNLCTFSWLLALLRAPLPSFHSVLSVPTALLWPIGSSVYALRDQQTGCRFRPLRDHHTAKMLAPTMPGSRTTPHMPRQVLPGTNSFRQVLAGFMRFREHDQNACPQALADPRPRAKCFVPSTRGFRDHGAHASPLIEIDKTWMGQNSHNTDSTGEKRPSRKMLVS